MIAPVVGPDDQPGPQLLELWERHPETRHAGEPRLVSLDTEDAVDDDSNRVAGRAIDRALMKAMLDETPLVACLSGGRKSMTAWLTISASLTAREQDRLVHVTVPKEYERRDFFFPPQPSTDLVRVAEVPLVRLRSLVGEQRMDDSSGPSRPRTAKARPETRNLSGSRPS